VNEIFLSYRRADERGTTGRLYDHLAQAFGKDAIFYDVEKIPRGVDFREYIDQTIRQCRVVLVVIGPVWASIKDEKGRRLDQANDPVRIEVETALRWNKKIIPVLTDDAGMPAGADLPATIERLASLNASPMHNNQYFEQDINTLLDEVTRMGVTRKVQGPIINPPSAGFNVRTAAAVASIPLIFITLGVVAIIAVGYFAYSFLGGNLFSGYASNGAHGVLSSFCTALQHHDYNTAYSDMDSNLQQTVGSPSNIAGSLMKDFFGDPVTVVGCQPFASGPIDGFYHESGNSANDDVEFNANKADGSTETVDKTVFFVKVNGSWKLDRIQDQ
jgi:TIR domain-containing protein